MAEVNYTLEWRPISFDKVAPEKCKHPGPAILTSRHFNHVTGKEDWLVAFCYACGSVVAGNDYEEYLISNGFTCNSDGSLSFPPQPPQPLTAQELSVICDEAKSETILLKLKGRKKGNCCKVMDGVMGDVIGCEEGFTVVSVKVADLKRVLSLMGTIVNEN